MSLLFEQVKLRAHSHPNRPALIWNEEIVSYRDLWRGVAQICANLRDIGVKQGDRVILLAGSAERRFVATYLSVHALGAVAVPIDPLSPPAKKEFIEGRVSAVLSVSSQPAQGVVPQCSYESLAIDGGAISGDSAFDGVSLGPEDPADILFTTGTTGRPKGVVLSHRNISAAAENINAFIGNDQNDLEVVTLPLSHSFGLGRVRCVLAAGGGMILINGLSFPGLIVKAVEDHGATGLALVPSAARILFRMGKESWSVLGDRLAYVELGSAPMDVADKRLLTTLLPNSRICMHYGLTEASRSAFMEFHADSARLKSIGRPSPNVELCVVGKHGKRVRGSGLGHLLVKGDHVFQGYLDESGDLVKREGAWFDTGDMATVDADGYFNLAGRASEVINVGGRKVSPIEVESVLIGFPGVRECACVGVPDPKNVTGQAVKAFIVPEPSLSQLPEVAAFRTFLADKLEPYKIPTIYESIDRLIKTESGKIQRIAMASIDSHSSSE